MGKEGRNFEGDGFGTEGGGPDFIGLVVAIHFGEIENCESIFDVFVREVMFSFGIECRRRCSLPIAKSKPLVKRNNLILAREVGNRI